MYKSRMYSYRFARHLASCKQWTLLFLRGVRLDEQAVAEKLESTQKRLGILWPLKLIMIVRTMLRMIVMMIIMLIMIIMTMIIMTMTTKQNDNDDNDLRL